MKTKWITILIICLAGTMGVFAEKSLKEKAYEYYSSISPEFKKYEAKLEPEKVSNLGMKEMDDEGMQYLTVFPNLRTLNISDSLITDEGLKQIFTLSKLDDLTVRRTKITNKGIEYVSKSKTITSLFLDEIQGIDDGCIPHLLKMKQLTTLELSGTDISEQGLKKLRKGLKASVTTQ
ncbi:leucine rich repeat protein [Leptospira weilii str. Ecochallenge]|uniref:Leucine rich repeat protein n=1 Tax=Leptospira weilii str. Ecochallenge TaxID=1049986 RepID=N1UES2_9LEPT|nr:leucine rich repeat protein [Leptospira weilii str. Ecochallenge]